MVVPAEKRGGARVRLGEARRADGAQFPTGRMPNGADRNGVRADRGGGTPGVRSETRERGDDGARVDREEIERARRPTGVDDGRARQRRRARPIREISQNRTSVRRRAQKSPFNRSSGPPKGAFEPPSARPRALPLAHSPVPLEETRSRQDRAPSAWRARRDRRLPTSARPKIDSLERQATEKLAVQKPARISPTSPSWTGDHACRHRFADDAQSQRVLNWLTVYPYGIANSKRGPRNRRGSRTDDREKQARRSLLASVSSPSPFRAAASSLARGAPSRDETTMSAVACASLTTAPVATPTRVRARPSPHEPRAPARARAPRSRAPPTPTTDP